MRYIDMYKNMFILCILALVLSMGDGMGEVSMISSNGSAVDSIDIVTTSAEAGFRVSLVVYDTMGHPMADNGTLKIEVYDDQGMNDLVGTEELEIKQSAFFWSNGWSKLWGSPRIYFDEYKGGEPRDLYCRATYTSSNGKVVEHEFTPYINR
jgi:hypothetical protein